MRNRVMMLSILILSGCTKAEWTTRGERNFPQHGYYYGDQLANPQKFDSVVGTIKHPDVGYIFYEDNSNREFVLNDNSSLVPYVNRHVKITGYLGLNDQKLRVVKVEVVK